LKTNIIASKRAMTMFFFPEVKVKHKTENSLTTNSIFRAALTVHLNKN